MPGEPQAVAAIHVFNLQCVESGSLFLVYPCTRTISSTCLQVLRSENRAEPPSALTLLMHALMSEAACCVSAFCIV